MAAKMTVIKIQLSYEMKNIDMVKFLPCFQIFGILFTLTAAEFQKISAFVANIFMSIALFIGLILTGECSFITQLQHQIVFSKNISKLIINLAIQMYEPLWHHLKWPSTQAILRYVCRLCASLTLIEPFDAHRL